MSGPIPSRHFACVLADPPWPADDQGSRMAPAYAGKGRDYAVYPVQELAEILALGDGVRRIAADNAFLFLWIPNYLLIEGVGAAVCRAWGFEPKQAIPWLKTAANGQPRIGGGHYTRVCTEQMVLARRGRAEVLRRDIPGVLRTEAPALEAVRPNHHSAKPDESYLLIEALVPGPRIELYARRRFGAGWKTWGNEQSDYDLDALQPAGWLQGELIA